MRRRTFDALMTLAGATLTVVLAIAAGLMFWGSSFVHGQVHDQLNDQKIFFPTVESGALDDPAIKPYLTKYAGEQLLTGQQAEAYADHFIKVHVEEATKAVNQDAYGKDAPLSYAELGNVTHDESLSQEQRDAASAARDTAYKGETLRGLLLNAYAFDTMATILGWGAIASLIGAAVLLVLTLLGWRHLRKTPEDAQL